MRHARSPWTIIPRPQPEARLRLICFPHAGGGASTYFGWGVALAAAGIEVRAVQYPGRESRFNEACLTTCTEMMEAVVAQWGEIAGDAPCALYGHSMGAVLAYETASALAQAKRRPPVHLFVSGHGSPDLPYRAPRVSTLPAPEFLPAVARHFGGIPAELLDDPEVAAVIAPVLRADFSLIENYRWRPGPPLEVPISALGGKGDFWATGDELRRWSQFTRGAFSLRMFPGDHFFLQAQRENVWAAIHAELALPDGAAGRDG